MTDGQWLFTLFLVLYLVESLRLQPKSAWLLTGRDRLSRPFLPLDFAGRHLLLLPILPPFQAFGNLRSWELVPCADGLELLDAQNGQHHVLSWDGLNPTCDGSKLILSEEKVLHCVNQASATGWQERVLRWKKLPQAAREKDFLKLAVKTLDNAALCVSLKQITLQTRFLRLLGTLIFFTCFGVITVIYRRYGDGREVLIAAATLLSLQWLQALCFWRSSRRLSTPLKHRFWKALACAFLPQNAMRAADHLCEALSPEAHPLAAASSMGDSAKLALVRCFWKSIQHTSAASAALQQRAFAAFLKAQNIQEDQLQEIPEKQPGSAAYCPRCLAQFRDAEARCKDCGDAALNAF
jgi:hypothetical protein